MLLVDEEFSQSIGACGVGLVLAGNLLDPLENGRPFPDGILVLVLENGRPFADGSLVPTLENGRPFAGGIQFPVLESGALGALFLEPGPARTKKTRWVGRNSCRKNTVVRST